MNRTAAGDPREAASANVVRDVITKLQSDALCGLDRLAATDEQLVITQARRSDRVRRIELQSPWAVCVPDSVGTTLHAVLHGACWLLAGAESPPVPLRRGDLVLLPRGARHALVDDPAIAPFDLRSWRSPGPGRTVPGANGRRSTLLSGGYRLRRPLPFLAALPEVVHVHADRRRNHRVRAIVHLLGAELEEGGPGATAVVPALTDALLPLVVRAWLDESAAGRGGDSLETSRDLAIAAALERIHAEPERAWTVKALAREVALSRSAFVRRFARAVGEPPRPYLTHWRMIVAGRLLHDSDLKLAAVASRVGYGSEFAFAKAFKREYGIAPGAYRRQLAA